MSTTETKRPLLPMLGHTRGKRSPVTCALKCDNACAKGVCNQSGNEYFRDIASAAYSRRNILGLGAAGAVGLMVGSAALDATSAQAAAGRPGTPAGSAKGRLPFIPIAPVDAKVDAFTTPAGYDWETILRWGDPLFNDAPVFDATRQTAETQARQFGYNNDYLEILRTPNSKKGLLVCNHEYVNQNIMFDPANAPAEAVELRAVTRAAVGMSVVELERDHKGNPWRYIKGARLNRRITMDSEFGFTGPAAGSDLLKTVEDPQGMTVRGTLGNCAGGTTPWGTILSGEENFNGYFRSPANTEARRRYGFTNTPTGTGWEQDEPRFDANNAGYENEQNRFGYIVEIDPQDPPSTPVKHTSLGRFKHEGATISVAANGHVVAYSGDDERFDYLYKFVSKKKFRKGNGPKQREHNKTLLSEGDLYVAKFSGNSSGEIDGSGELPDDGAFDGTGQWLPLVVGGKSRINGMSIAEVLVYTRLAADKAGATKMDRCEDVEPNPATGKAYVACTNNTDRGTAGHAEPNEANPRTINRDGHVVEISERFGDQTATSFNWNLLMVCGDPATNDSTYFGGFPPEAVSPISCPDNLAFDSSGQLWISTDGQPGTIGLNDGLFKVDLQGAFRGRVQQFLAVPRDAETCGPIIHDDESMVYVAVQHPGEEGSYTEPTSFFPDYVDQEEAPAGQFRGPRPSVVQVFPSVR
ncbi:PhoX family protein [Arthrobacter pigmenti]